MRGRYDNTDRTIYGIQKIANVAKSLQGYVAIMVGRVKGKKTGAGFWSVRCGVVGSYCSCDE